MTSLTEPARPGGDRLLLASDGTPVMAWHDPCRPAVGAGPAEAAPAFVVAHGFTVHARRPDVRAVVAALRPHGGVVSFDFRGHGLSGGASTVGDREVEDVAAAVRWARALGYRRVVTVGWSMGAAVVVRHAALPRPVAAGGGGAAAGEDAGGDGVDAVVAVSGPSRWHFRGTAPMRLLHRGVETRAGRAVLAGLFGTRVAPSGWDPVPEPPDAVAGRIAPVPLLVVHGDADRYFPVDHARWLAAAAGPTARLWEVPGFGHAEAAVGAALVDRIGRWARAAVTGAPAGDPVDGGDGHPAASARMPA